MSKRKKRGKGAKAEARSTDSSAKDSGDAGNNTPAVQPPRRDVIALVVLSGLFFIWVLFLVYVAVFG